MRSNYNWFGVYVEFRGTLEIVGEVGIGTISTSTSTETQELVSGNISSDILINVWFVWYRR